MTSASQGQQRELLSLRGINKSFGAVHVLRDVDFDVRPGEVTALVGDNGAGKSTLIKCVAGIHPFDSGEMVFEGSPITIHGPKDANALGIEIVYQDLALCDNLDVVHNMFLGREVKSGLTLNETEMEKRAGTTLKSLSVQFRGLGVPEKEITITSKPRGDGEFDTEAVQDGNKLVRRGKAVLRI